MHKNIAVMDLELDEVTGSIRKNGKVYSEEHIPVGVPVRKGTADRAALNDWWSDRCIPASRSGVKQALLLLDVSNTKMLISRCFGLSLSDQYWVKPEGSELDFHDINFFENPFSEDIGDVLMGKAKKLENFDFSSPDNTSDGCLKKRWKIINDRRCLIKGGSNPFMQQPFNEVAACIIMEKLEIPHVNYTLLWDDGVPYSVCEDFITPNTELISAYRVMQTKKKDNKTSVYRHYIDCCESLGIADIAHSVDRMIVLDYLIANEDRHQNNFGLVRDADTLRWIGAAPIFDSGSSFGYDKLATQIRSGKGVECKPFKKTHEQQLQLVTSFDWIDFDRLKKTPQEIKAVFDTAGEYIDNGRKEAIIASLISRIGYLENHAALNIKYIDDTKNDVKVNVAEDYTSETKISNDDLFRKSQ